MAETQMEENIKLAIKGLMKRQGFQYSDLAEELNCSLPTVKRLLTSGELDLARLLRICQWLNISLSELEKLARVESRSQQSVFTMEQEEFLAKNPGYLSFLSHLYSGDSVELIAKKYSLTKKSVELYQIRLEKLGLMKSKGGKYRLVHADFPDLIPTGPIFRTQFLQIIDFSNNFFKKRVGEIIKNPDLKRSTRIGFLVERVPADLYSSWRNKYDELMEELSTIGKLYSKAPGHETLDRVIVSGFQALLKWDDPSYDAPEYIFGKIENL